MMNRDGDAASCAALGAVLLSGAGQLDDAATRDDGCRADPRLWAEVGELTRALRTLGNALTDFATGLRDPRPPRPGRPHPHTALRTACADVVSSFDGRADAPA